VAQNKVEITEELLKGMKHIELREDREDVNPNSDELVKKLIVPKEHRVTD